MNFRPKSISSKPSMNITPILDMVFILLLFFAVSTTFTDKSSMDITLPDSETATEQKKDAEVSIVISKDGTIELNQKVMGKDELETELKRLYDINPLAVVVIAADREASHGDVVTAIDISKVAGFEDFAIATEKKK